MAAGCGSRCFDRTCIRAKNIFGRIRPGKAKEDAAAQEKSIREQDIYIPYDKLRQVFEKHGRGVFLPYDKFQELWKAAQDKTQPAAEIKPPVGAVITEIENEATVEKDVVRVKAKVKIELLAEGWQEIPLRLSDAAITSAKLGDQPARILGAAGQDYRLLIEKKGKQPEQIELNLEYAKAITRSPGQNSVSFQTPQAPVSRWKVTIPQAGVKVNLQPLIAATEVPPGDKTSAEADKEKRPTKPWSWRSSAPRRPCRSIGRPRPKAPPAWRPWPSVQTQQQLWINESVTHCTTTLDYAISRAELAKLAIEVPGRLQSRQRLRRQRAAMVGRGGRRQAENHRRNCSSRPRNRSASWWNWKKSPARKRRTRSKPRSSRPWKPAGSKALWWCKSPKACAAKPRKPAGCCKSTPPNCRPRWPAKNGRFPIATPRRRTI